MKWKKVSLLPFTPAGTLVSHDLHDGHPLSRPGRAPCPDAAPKRPCVLVIDDSATIRKIIEVCLGREGMQVISYGDPIEALRALNAPLAVLPDLAFIDIGLPKKDGYQVMRYLGARPRFRRMVIIGMSGRSGTIDRLKARLAGANDYVIKPFKIEDIVALVHWFTSCKP
jgi:DNA-binding response OmpR family regulator